MLDREDVPEYVLRISSMDGTTKLDEKTVTIIVTDVNDNKPVFDQDSLKMILQEDAKQGFY